MKADRLRQLAMQLRIEVPRDMSAVDIMDRLLDRAEADDDDYLDLVDGALHVWSFVQTGNHVEQILRDGGSVWRVGDDGASLVRRVGREAQAAYDLAVAIRDPASIELEQAWSHAYGRNPDPSDAWDHAIKAVEAVICHVVEPNKPKPTLGSTLGLLAQQGANWQCLLPGKDLDNSVEPLVSMLRLLWPNPDRHGTAAARPPTTAEGQAAVGIAVLVLQWARIDHVVRKR